MPEMKNNILDYLDWRGDLSFSAAPFCEVDNLIFCMLSFADFSPAVSADPTGVPVKLSDASRVMLMMNDIIYHYICESDNEAKRQHKKNESLFVQCPAEKHIYKRCD